MKGGREEVEGGRKGGRISVEGGNYRDFREEGKHFREGGREKGGNQGREGGREGGIFWRKGGNYGRDNEPIGPDLRMEYNNYTQTENSLSPLICVVWLTLVVYHGVRAG